MVELLRRSSLERRNEQLIRRLNQFEDSKPQERLAVEDGLPEMWKSTQ